MSTCFVGQSQGLELLGFWRYRVETLTQIDKTVCVNARGRYRVGPNILVYLTTSHSKFSKTQTHDDAARQGRARDKIGHGPFQSRMHARALY